MAKPMEGIGFQAQQQDHHQTKIGDQVKAEQALGEQQQLYNEVNAPALDISQLLKFHVPPTSPFGY